MNISNLFPTAERINILRRIIYRKEPLAFTFLFPNFTAISLITTFVEDTTPPVLPFGHSLIAEWPNGK